MGIPQFQDPSVLIVQQIQTTANQISADVTTLKNTDVAGLAAAVVNKKGATKYTKSNTSVALANLQTAVLLNVTGKGYISLAAAVPQYSGQGSKFIITKDGVAETFTFGTAGGTSLLAGYMPYTPVAIAGVSYKDKSYSDFYTGYGGVHPLVDELLFFSTSLKLELYCQSAQNYSYLYHVGVLP
jgi:hypothetical protein